jgi:protein required for attachment to host cells
MSKLKIDTGEWVVVCDGGKALILENIGDHISPNLRTVETRTHPDPLTHEQGTDSPGRVHASVGSARSSVEQTDWHEQSEREFLHELIGRLDTALKNGETKALIMVAPPRALGVLRQHYTAPVKAALRDEVDKDLVKVPIYDIEKRLFA